MHAIVLLVATLRAVGTAFVMAVAGIIAARQGFITSPGRRCLSELSMNIFMPLLLFSSVISCNPGEPCKSTITVIKEAWYLFVFPFWVVASGLALGSITAALTGCPSSFKRGCIGAVAFANSTGMSITILGILGPVLVREGVVNENPLKFQPVYLILYPMLQWSVGSYLFGLAKKTDGASDPECGKEQKQEVKQKQEAVLMRATSQTAVQRAVTRGSRGFVSARDSMRSLTLLSIASVPSMADINLAHEPCLAPLDVPFAGSVRYIESAAGHPVSDSEATSDSSSSDCSTTCSKRQRKKVTCVQCCVRVSKGIFRNAVVPPVIGAVLGVIVASIPELRRLLVHVDEADPRPCLGFIFQALAKIGSASVPVNMLVLGSNLAQGANLKALPCATTIGIILMKQLIQPVTTGVAIYVLARLIGGSLEVFFVMVVMGCTPTANNIMIMVELSGQSKEAMTSCIFAQYLVAPATITLVITGALILFQSSWFLPPGMVSTSSGI